MNYAHPGHPIAAAGRPTRLGSKAPASFRLRQFRSWFRLLGCILCFTAHAQTEYTGDGVPTALEEEIRWRVNRGRFDSAAENVYRGTNYTGLAPTLGPLAPNQKITLAARHHSEDMATKNVLQHDTVAGSLYYNATTQPKFWDRMTAEGYTWSTVGENVAAGYTNAEAVYVAWWKSGGHRTNMYNGDFREIGNGYYDWAQSTYGHYYTMDLGRSGTACFFTDTLFADSNSNGVYNASEGLSGIAVRLQVGTNLLGFYDRSSAVGSFAVPLAAIATGATVVVVFSNSAPTNLVLSIPTSHSSLQTFNLAAGQSRTYGTFVKAPGNPNVGLRNLSPLAPPVLTNTPVQLLSGRAGFHLSWYGEWGASYVPQLSPDLRSWSDLSITPLLGTGATITYPVALTNRAGFYRLKISAP